MKTTKSTYLNPEIMNSPKIALESKIIYVYICFSLGDKDSVEITVKQFTDALGFCRQTFNKYRDILIEQNIIEVRRVGFSGGGSRLEYSIPDGLRGGVSDEI